MTVKGKRKGIAWHVSREGRACVRMCVCVRIHTYIRVCARVHTNAIGRSITYPRAPAVTGVVGELSPWPRCELAFNYIVSVEASRTRCELASSYSVSAEASWSSAGSCRLAWPWLPRGKWPRPSSSDFPPSAQAQNSSTRHRSLSKRVLVHCAASPLAGVLRSRVRSASNHFLFLCQVLKLWCWRSR